MAIGPCPWYVAGPLFGLLIVGLRAVLNKPFGALGGYIDLATARSSARPGFRIPMLLGIVLGGAIYAATLQGALVRRRAERKTALPIQIEAPGTTGL